ncbi:hypothetical protein L1049_012301 [Liquidambar formosana]|uniref:Uncharacterized protein n=1 Tax=Liquidambar formosana TaxID=63359 RepID=A0AAP0RXW3_LIQFO
MPASYYLKNEMPNDRCPLESNAISPTLLRSSKPKSKTRKNPKRFVIHAENGDGLSKDPKEGGGGDDGSNGGDDLKRDRRPIFNLKWRDLLDPDPNNILAVGLTGLLTWASVQVLWQLFFISLAILVAAVKYSFIAALLLFILITLL